MQTAIIAGKWESASARHIKAEAPASPKAGASTLQSQFSQGESMNEQIVKVATVAWVAEFLQRPCELAAAPIDGVDWEDRRD